MLVIVKEYHYNIYQTHKLSTTYGILPVASSTIFMDGQENVILYSQPLDLMDGIDPVVPIFVDFYTMKQHIKSITIHNVTNPLSGCN